MYQRISYRLFKKIFFTTLITKFLEDIDILGRLFELLKLVADHADYNMMKPENLAICWNPFLFQVC